MSRLLAFWSAAAVMAMLAGTSRSMRLRKRMNS